MRRACGFGGAEGRGVGGAEALGTEENDGRVEVVDVGTSGCGD